MDFEKRRIQIMEEGRKQAILLAELEFEGRIKAFEAGSFTYEEELKLHRANLEKINKEWDKKELEETRKMAEERARLIQEGLKYPGYEVPEGEPQWVKDAKEVLRKHDQQEYELSVQFNKAINMPGYEAPPMEDWEAEGWSKRKAWEAKNLQDELDKLREQFGPLMDAVNRFESTWVNIFSNLSDSTKSFSDRIKDTFRSLADSVIADAMRMIYHLLLFGSIQGMGGFKPGTAVSGVLGLFGVKAFASGGIVNKPTMAMIGEAGPEAVVPLGKGSQGMGNTINYIHINALDPQSFSEFVKRNPGAILKEVHRDARANGPMRQI